MTTAANRRHRLLASTALLPAAGIIALAPSAAYGQDRTWDGGGANADWSTATNWDTDTVPGPIDLVTINGDGGPNQPVISTNQNVGLVTVTGGTLTVDATLSSTTLVSQFGILRINAGGQVASTVRINAAFNPSSSAGTINGPLVVNGGTFNNAGVVTGETTVSAGTLILNAGSNLSDAELLSVTGGTVNVNTTETVGGLSGTGGTINLATGIRLIVNQAGNSTFSGAFTASGGVGEVYLQKAGAGTLSLAGNNTGTGVGEVFVGGGTLQLQGGNAIGDQNTIQIGAGTVRLLENETIGALLGGSSGTLDVNGRTLTLAGIGQTDSTSDVVNLAGSGVFRIASPVGSTQMDGAHSFTGTYQVSAGTLRLGGTGSASASLLVDGGTLNLTANRTFSSVVLDGGTISGTGTLTSTSPFDLRAGTVSAVLAGGVGLVKSTAGTVTLSGANTYLLGTIVSAGTLIAANNSALGSTAENTIVGAGATLGLQGGITIGEALTLNGSGVGGNGALRNISGTNVVTGNISLASAASIASDAGILQVNGTVDNFGNLLTSAGSGGTAFVGVISGSGGFTKDGSGQTDLNGTNTYQGTTTVNNGALILNGGSAILDTGRVVVNGGAFGIFNDETIGSLAGTGGFVSSSAGSGTNRLTVGGNDQSTSYAGDLRNNGANGLFALGKIGTGTLTLTANNSFSGGTTISGGTLQIGNGGTTGTIGSGAIVNNAALVFNRSNNLTVSNVISGSGSLTKEGAGNLTLSGANSYSGLTTVNAGTLTVTNAEALGTGAGGTVVASGASLHLLGAIDFTTEAVTINGFGAFNSGALRSSVGSNGFSATAVTLGSDARINSDFELSLNSVIGGGNALTLGGTGRLFINNNMSGVTSLTTDGTGIKFVRAGGPTGATTVTNGVLVVDMGGSLSDTALVTVEAPGIIRFGASDTIGGLTGTGVFEILSGELTTGANNASTTFAGVLGGSGGLIKTGTGIFTLSGLNFHSGTTTISGGTLQIGNGGTGGELGSGNVVNNTALVFNRSNNFTVSNVISGSGSLTKQGAGTLTLSGASSYTGLTTVSQGTLLVSNVAGLGTAAGGTLVEDGASLAFTNSARYDIQDIITINGAGVNGEGALQGRGFDVVIANPLVLGSNSTVGLYSGVMTLNGVNGLDRNLTLNAVANTTMLINGNLALGTGTLTKTGSGNLTIFDANTWTGNFNILAGNVQIADGLSGINAAIGDNARVTLNGGRLRFVQSETIGSLAGAAGSIVGDFNLGRTLTFGGNNESQIFDGQIVEALSIVKTGFGVISLTGDNTYSGTTTILGGTMRIGNGGTTGTLGTGNVVNNAALIFNRSNDLTAANAISGTGSLTKQGTGTLTLTGNSSYSGTTTISGGTLQIGNGGTTGAIGNGAIVNNATLAFNRSDNLTVTNGITGSGSLVKSGAGNLTVSSSINLDGGLTVNAGTLTLTGNNNNLGQTASINGGLEIQNGGRLRNTFGRIGVNAGQSGTAIVTGTDSRWTVSEGLQIGLFGTGALTISAGGSTVANSPPGLISLSVGNSAGGQGTVLVTGAGSLSQNAGQIQIGRFGEGSLTIADGGIVRSTFTTPDLPSSIFGTFAGSRATVVVTGAGSRYDNAGLLVIGREGSAALTIADGGVVEASGIFMATRAISTSTLNFGAAEGSAAIAAGTLTTPTITFGGLSETGTGTIVFNHTNTDFELAAAISGIGTLRQIAGTTILSGASGGFTGTTQVTGGTLQVIGTLGGAVNVTGGTLGGTGTFDGAVTIGNGGTLAAGQSPGTMTVASLALEAGSTSIFELGEAGVAGGPNNDLVNVTGELALNGGNIVIERGAGFGSGQFTLFTFGTLSGSLGNLILDPVGGGFFGNLAIDGSTMVLNTAAAAELVVWNGSTLSPTGSVVGGDGTWSLAGTNFTNAAGNVSGPWAGNGALAVFDGTGGVVTIAAGETVAPSGISFAANGYSIVGGDAASRLELTGATGINTAGGISATIAAVMAGNGSLTKTGTGTLVLTGDNTFTGQTTAVGGVLVNEGTLAGDVSVAATFSNLGTVAGGLTVTNSGSAANAAGASVTGLTDIASGGVLTNAGALGAVTNAGQLTSTGAIFGGLANSGTAAIEGVLTGNVSNGGTITLTGLTSGIGALTQTVGALFDNGAFATEVGSLAGDGTVEVDSGGIFTLGSDDSSTTFAGGFEGSGQVIKTGSGTFMLTGTSGLTGPLQITDGALVVAAGASLAGNVGNDAQLTNSGTIAGQVTASGTTLNNGTINGGASNSGTFTNAGVVNGGFTNTASLTSDGTITGGLTQLTSSSAVLSGTLNGAVSNAGLITVAGNLASNGLLENTLGRVVVNAGATWSGLTGIDNASPDATGILVNGTLQTAGNVVNRAGAAITVAATGRLEALTILNAGTLASAGTLVGNLDNSGTASLAGTLTGNVANSAAITLTGTTTGIGTLDQTASGVFNLGGFATSINAIGGSGRIELGMANLTVAVGDNSRIFAGVIAGEGGLIKNGADTLRLSGVNAYAGLTTINAGVLQIETGGAIVRSVQNNAGLINSGTIGGNVVNDGTMSNAGRINGNVTNNGALALGGRVDGNLDNNAAVTSSGAVVIGRYTQAAGGSSAFTGGTVTLGSLAGAGTISLDGTTLTLGTDNTSLTFAGAISGSGALNKNGSGTFTLTGMNTFAGNTQVGAGTLVVASGAGLAGSVVNNNNFTNAGTIGGQVTNGAGGTGNSSGTIGGALVNRGFFTNSGTVSGLASNTGTLNSIGTLSGGLSNEGGSANVRGVVSGDVFNSGLVTLTGTTTGITLFEQTSTGRLELAGFDTSLGALLGTGGVTLGAARLTVGSANLNTLFSGVIAGSGGLTKVGTGRLVLTGASTYTGGTTISGGVLQLGDGGTSGSIAGPVVNNGALVFNRSDAFTFANVISGTGMVMQDGTGTTTLTAANTYSGGTRVVRGRLVGNTTSLQGLIQIDAGAALEFAQTSTGTFAGSLAGAGLFDKTGAGLLTLTGNSNAFTGATSVRGGELRVNGGLAGSVVTVGTGATLSGTGVIGGLIAQSGSTIAPGTSPGTLSVAGNVTLQAGSTTVFEVSATGPSDLILATGTAALGGTASLANLGGTYAFNSEYVLLSADGGRSGTFAATTGTSGFGILYRPELIYTPNQVRLRMAPNLLANIVGNTALTANQRSVVNRIDGAVTAGYNPQPLFNVYSLPTAQLPGAFDQLSGEAYATAAGVGIDQERMVREAVLGRLGSVALSARTAPDLAKGVQAWGQLFGGWGDGEGDGNASAYEADRMGFVTGLDVGGAGDSGHWRAGLFGMRVQSDVTIDARGSASEVEQWGGGGYAALGAGGFAAVVGGYMAEVDMRTFRDIALPGFAETNVGTTEGKARQAFAELSYSIAAGDATIRPFVAGSIGSFRLDALTESGGAAALVMREQRYDTGTLTGGVDGAVAVSKALRLEGMVAARRQLGDRAPEASLALAAAPQQAFAVRGVQLDKTAISTRLEAQLQLEENLAITLGYSGLLGDTIKDHAARATISVRF